MKRFFLMWGLVVALLLSGCGSSASRVETLKSWSFQYNEGTSDYSLFFGLADKNDKSLSADVDVGIRIVNDADEEVYTVQSPFLLMISATIPAKLPESSILPM